uniref:Uncharacterized protein n=1 Tax=Panagrolaimus sp. ES5 TaxID=591445 RepID=A0AC34FI63_9BILA
MKFLLFATFFFIASAKAAPVQNLGDQVIRQEQVALFVLYKGRNLNVWRQDIDGYSRFYVTPLCIVDLNSFSCNKNEYQVPSRWVFSFKVKLWDFDVATVVQKALKQKGISAQTGDIIILPMQSVRVGLRDATPNIKTDNKWTPYGMVYLKSEDANKLAHEVFNSVSFDEEVSSDYKESKNEDSIIKELLKIFQQDKIQSIKLTDEKWDSVFWDDIFTRPDIQTSYLNNVMKYNENENNFKFDKKSADAFRQKVATEHTDSNSFSVGVGASFAGFGANVETSVSDSHSDANSSDQQKKTASAIKVEDFEKLINDRKMNVEWKGKKFVQKSFDLYRINTKELKTTSENAFKRVIVSKEKVGQKIDIKVETNATDFEHIYDEKTTIPTTTTTTPATTTTTSTTTTTTTTTAKPTTAGTTLLPCNGISDGKEIEGTDTSGKPCKRAVKDAAGGTVIDLSALG